VLVSKPVLYGCRVAGWTGGVCDLREEIAAGQRRGMAIFIACRIRRGRCRGDLTVPRQTFHARRVGDASVLLVVLILICGYPLSKYGVACAGNTVIGLKETRTTCIWPPHSPQRTGGLGQGVSCGARRAANQ